VGGLVPVLNVYAPRLVLSEGNKYLKNISAKCCFTEKSKFSRSLWLIKMTLTNYPPKNLWGVLASVHNFSAPRVF